MLKIPYDLVRIRIRGSVPLINGSGSGSGSCYFSLGPSRRQQSFSAYNFLMVHVHNFSKLKCHKALTKQKESRFFLLFLLDDWRIRIRPYPYLWLAVPDLDPGGPKTYRSGSTTLPVRLGHEFSDPTWSGSTTLASGGVSRAPSSGDHSISLWVLRDGPR